MSIYMLETYRIVQLYNKKLLFSILLIEVKLKDACTINSKRE
jgi:hypothetical protein